MPKFCQQNVHSLKKTLLQCRYFVKKTFILLKMSFFQIFHEKPHAGMPIFGQKNVNFVKTTINYGPKKSKGCPFVSYFFARKNINSHAHILSKKRSFQKKTLLSCPYFVKKTFIISKTRCSHVIFFNFFMKNPCCHTHIWSKKHQFCQNYTILWDKKSQ